MLEKGCAFGRFQLPHMGHLEHLLKASAQCTHLIVGISSPDPEQMRPSKNDPSRHLSSSNPFTYFDRVKMVEGMLLEEGGLSRDRITIVPFPIDYPERIHNYVPKNVTIFLSILEEWGHEKQERLADSGYTTQDLGVTYKRMSASEIRQLIRGGKDWKHLVPNSVSKYIDTNGLVKRVLETK